jgi:hypothetical protein
MARKGTPEAQIRRVSTKQLRALVALGDFRQAIAEAELARRGEKI